ncbi:MAG: AAA family ATPase [Bacteroides sp.]|nr:AAA family ATPase [Bacteroides sp.]
MLYRKIERSIREYLTERNDRILGVSGARQIGKSYIIRHIGQQLFKNYVELNLIENRDMREAF